MEIITSKYIMFDIAEGVITIFNDKKPSTNGLTTVMENVVIEINESNCIVFGDRWIWDFSWQKNFEFSEQPIQSHIKVGYRNLLHRIKGVKSPYVEGWYRQEKSIPCSIVTNQYIIQEAK